METALEEAAEQQEAKVTKHKPAGANVNGIGGAQEPDDYADEQGGANGDGDKVGNSTPHDEAAQHQQGKCVGKKVFHPGVKKWH